MSGRAALLIIDMQRQCRADTTCPEVFDEAVWHINEAARLFRELGLPVVVVRDEGVGEGPGSEGFEVVDRIERAPGDLSVDKKYNSAFWRTNLEEMLRAHGVTFVVASGFAAEYCVLFTYNGAVERGFGVSLLQNGVAGVRRDEVERIQRLRPVVSLDALTALLP